MGVSQGVILEKELSQKVNTYGLYGLPNGIQDDLQKFFDDSQKTAYFKLGKTGKYVKKTKLTYDILLTTNNYLRFNFYVVCYYINEQLYANLMKLGKNDFNFYIRFFKRNNYKKFSRNMKIWIINVKNLLSKAEYDTKEAQKKIGFAKSKEDKQKYRTEFEKFAKRHYKKNKLFNALKNLIIKKKQFNLIIGYLYEDRIIGEINVKEVIKLMSGINLYKSEKQGGKNKDYMQKYIDKNVTILLKNFEFSSLYVVDMLVLQDNVGYHFREDKFIFYEDRNLNVYSLNNKVYLLLEHLEYNLNMVKIYNINEYYVKNE